MLLIDSDVLLDVALRREPHFADSERILLAIEGGAEDAAMAWHTIANLNYLVRRERGDAAAREFIERLQRTLVVPPTGSDDLSFTLSLPMSDFEDAMQGAAARACGARFIVSRNKRDFKKSPIRAYPASEALALLR